MSRKTFRGAENAPYDQDYAYGGVQHIGDDMRINEQRRAYRAADERTEGVIFEELFHFLLSSSFLLPLRALVYYITYPEKNQENRQSR